MLLGPRDFADFRRDIISDISEGIEGATKREFPTRSHMNSPIMIKVCFISALKR